MTDKVIVHVADWMASADPVAKLHQLRESGWVEEFFPELHKLYGVPQVAEHHPEIDTGIHVELVLEVATKLSTDPRARWAALVHDLGKGLTPAHVLPQHIDHEERGVDLALEAAERFGLPEDWKWLGAMTSRHHLQAHRCLEMRPNSTIKFIRNAGFPSRPTLFECFVVACQADAQGRTGREDSPYPQAAYLREVFEVVREYEVQFLKLEQARISAVKPLLKKHAKKGVSPE
jgi:tRNA nucleotidyltransferase (CCA-adding enzyme)